MAEKYYTISPYVYCLNNPINVHDADGKSTHTDIEGNIIKVYNDGDNGVYSHEGKKNEILIKLKSQHNKNNPGGGIKKEKLSFGMSL
jgi:hypothetical protein